MDRALETRNEALARRLGKAALRRVRRRFTLNRQIEGLEEALGVAADLAIGT